MARVLLTGSSPLTQQVHAWLLRWEHSVVHAATESAFVAAASVRRVDAVVVVCEEGGLGGHCPGSLPVPADVAPRVLVGPGARACRRPDCYVEALPNPGRGGRHLRRAVRWCAQRAELMREHLSDIRVYHEYIQFLGHETRTPLTSALAALEILERELGGEGEPAGRRTEFVRLAARNLRRLGQTFEWTEDYLGARAAALAPRWREGRAGDFVAHAAGPGSPRPDLTLVFESGAEELSLLSDPSLLRALVQQALHALRYHAPGCRVTLRVSTAGGEPASWPGASATAGSHLLLAFHRDAPGESAAGGLTARAGLAERGEAPENELARLVQFTVARELLQVLCARLTIPLAGDGPVLQIVMPAVPVTARPAQPCDQCAPVCA